MGGKRVLIEMCPTSTRLPKQLRKRLCIKTHAIRKHTRYIVLGVGALYPTKPEIWVDRVPKKTPIPCILDKKGHKEYFVRDYGRLHRDGFGGWVL